MTKNIIALLLLAILPTSFLSGCSAGIQTFDLIHNKQVIENVSCGTADSYTYDHASEGYYKGFAADVHSQINLDNHTRLSADDIAYIAWLVNDTAVNKGQWESGVPVSWQKSALQRMLAHTHVIVAVDNAHLQNIWKTPTYQKLLARMTLSRYACFEPLNNTWFFTIVGKRFYKKDIDTVTHEMMHLVSRVYYGEFDDEHAYPTLWKKLSDNSLQAQFIKRYFPATTPVLKQLRATQGNS